MIKLEANGRKASGPRRVHRRGRGSSARAYLSAVNKIVRVARARRRPRKIGPWPVTANRRTSTGGSSRSGRSAICVSATTIPHRAEGVRRAASRCSRRHRDACSISAPATATCWARAGRAARRRRASASTSPTRCSTARATRFAGIDEVEIVRHDLDEPLPDGVGRVRRGRVVVRDPPPRRRRASARSTARCSTRLVPGGVFFNLEHVASPTPELHDEFLAAIGKTPETDDPSNKLVPVETHPVAARASASTTSNASGSGGRLASLAGRKPDVTECGYSLGVDDRHPGGAGGFVRRRCSSSCCSVRPMSSRPFSRR